jgi:hypothetical protein
VDIRKWGEKASPFPDFFKDSNHNKYSIKSLLFKMVCDKMRYNLKNTTLFVGVMPESF